ncbi:DEAD/DEAH box helicase family protein [Uliginosibacterium flavum]|uniref:DEAD/DEAH box helicase family protein n=1 Tax=Uliginosibacterium flavum TaxID=1396831 RepID=A0ABV2TG84_9RHOO
MAAKRSGHARLKAALVLRDALAQEVGLPLAAAMAQLRTVEGNVSTAQALTEGKYLDALASVSTGDTSHLAELDGRVRIACSRAQLAPRYAQYLALLLFAHWASALQDDAGALLIRLNAWLSAHKPKGEDVPDFTEADLQLAAFWMATAAGKTHVLHVCLALLEKQAWDRLIVITPSEALTRQHADKLRALGEWEVFAYPMDGDASAMGRLSPETVIVLDINKLATDKKGEGVTVPTSVFSEGRNLVFVDEGHKGQKSEASVWKEIQSTLAGIGAEQAKHRGLLIEFSATFGQVVEGENSFSRYAKAVVFDYAYDRFHQDRYGKDFWHVRVQSSTDADDAAQHETLTAALLAYWHQVASFRSADAKKAAKQANLKVAAPLWVLLGLSVIGSTKNDGDKEQTSDVVDVLCYLNGILSQPDRLYENLKGLLATATEGADLLPASVRAVVVGVDAKSLAGRVLADCFGWQAGDKPVLRLVKAATGELGLGLLRGDVTHYWGVVNVGDAAGLKKALEATGLAVEDDAMTGSLFARLDAPGSGLNVLVGSRRFAEGWDNYRASSLTLLRLGQGEGSLIIQMFGRVVRFAGVGGDGKRLEKPADVLAPLQTAYVYGLKSGYLNTFLQGLSDNGVHEVKRVECGVHKHAPMLLQSVRAIAPDKADFQTLVTGSQWLSSVKKTTVSLAASIATSGMQDGAVSARQGVAGQDITADFQKALGLIDRDAVYREMVEWKRSKQLWNFAFDMGAIDAALNSSKFEILGLPGMWRVREPADIARINRLAVTIVRRLFESAYRKQENKRSRYALIPAVKSGIPDLYYKEFLNVE